MKNHFAQPSQTAPKYVLSSTPGLHSFHHLLFDNLMPWLPFNGDVMVFRALEQHLSNKTSPVFEGLALQLQSAGIPVDPLLAKEWQLFSQLVPDDRWFSIYKSINKRLAPDARTYFFQQYMLQALLYTGTQLALVVTHATPATQQYVVNGVMKRLKDFQSRCLEFYDATDARVARILFVLSGLLFVLENEIMLRYRSLLDKKYLTYRFTPLMGDAMPQTDNRQMEVHFLDWLQHTYPTLPQAVVQTMPMAAEPAAAYSKNPKSSMQQPMNLRTAAMDDRLLSSDEASAMLGVSRKTMIKYAKEGLIDHTHFGKSYRFRKADVEQFIYQKKMN